MPNQSTPEIERLTEEAAYIGGGCSYVGLEQAIQAVRDTEARTVREIVEALRERARNEIAWADAFDAAADHVERTFLDGERAQTTAERGDSSTEEASRDHS